MKNFLTSKEYFRKSTRDRLAINPSQLCSYGIDFLDSHLTGVHPSELVLIGCESGKGKTTIVSHMATHNALMGKRVSFFRLEGDLNEFADLEKFKQLRKTFPHISYQKYRFNMYPEVNEYEQQMEDFLAEKFQNIRLFDKSKGLNHNNIHELVYSIKDESDLIIIDHLHYFDNGGEFDKYEQEKRVLKTLNELTGIFKIPIILVAHLRKKQGQHRKLPTIDDFMGSSDIFKIPHTVVLTAPDYMNYDNQKQQYSTFFYSPKSRVGASTNRVGIKIFDGASKEYLPGYEIYSYKPTVKGDWELEREQEGDISEGQGGGTSGNGEDLTGFES